MNVFIIGATGFLGYHATRVFLEHGHTVATVSLPPLPTSDLLPDEVSCTLSDINELSDEELKTLLTGYEVIVYAAGRDERIVPKAPAWEYFKRYNVDQCSRVLEIAKEMGCKKAVVLNSYFAYFDRLWPQYKLSERHPYIRSRVMQAEEAIRIGADSMDVMILELPYIFGSIPGRVPLWKDVLLDRFRDSKQIFCFKGGSACITGRQVGEAILGAVEHGTGGMRYPVGTHNMSWKELYRKLADHMGLEDRRLQMIPKWLLRLVLRTISHREKSQGLESGADHVKMADIYCRETYIDTSIAFDTLGVSPDDFDRALQETVEACYPEVEDMSNKERLIEFYEAKT